MGQSKERGLDVVDEQAAEFPLEAPPKRVMG